MNNNIWECHRCGQQNYKNTYQCIDCGTKKYICPNCGKVDYDYHKGRKATLLDRIKYVLFGGMESTEETNYEDY